MADHDKRTQRPRVIWQQAIQERERERKTAGAWVNDMMTEAKDG